ncbi:MAG: hypothetical protein WB586_24770 [Chthoniobacterales bacterium]
MRGFAPLVLGNCPLAAFPLLVILTHLVQLPELVVPERLERISHETIAGVHAHITDMSLLGFILDPLDILATQKVGLCQALLEFLLDAQGHFQSQRTDAFLDQRRECIIDYATGNAPTRWEIAFYLLLLTEIVSPPKIVGSCRPVICL